MRILFEYFLAPPLGLANVGLVIILAALLLWGCGPCGSGVGSCLDGCSYRYTNSTQERARCMRTCEKVCMRVASEKHD